MDDYLKLVSDRCETAALIRSDLMDNTLNVVLRVDMLGLADLDDLHAQIRVLDSKANIAFAQHNTNW